MGLSQEQGLISSDLDAEWNESERILLTYYNAGILTSSDTERVRHLVDAIDEQLRAARGEVVGIVDAVSALNLARLKYPSKSWIGDGIFGAVFGAMGGAIIGTVAGKFADDTTAVSNVVFVLVILGSILFARYRHQEHRRGRCENCSGTSRGRSPRRPESVSFGGSLVRHRLTGLPDGSSSHRMLHWRRAERAAIGRAQLRRLIAIGQRATPSVVASRPIAPFRTTANHDPVPPPFPCDLARAPGAGCPRGIGCANLAAIDRPQRDHPRRLRRRGCRPALTARHVALINRLRVMWVPVESGAPGIDPSQPLIGEGPPIALAKAALKTDDDALAIRTLAELDRLVPQFVAGAGTLAPGQYTIPPALRKLFAFKESGVDASGRFQLRAAHLTVLRGANWRTVDSDAIEDVLGEGDFWPMPYIDGKRPYGDRTYYQFDMAELLGESYKRDGRGNLVAEAKRMRGSNAFTMKRSLRCRYF